MSACENILLGLCLTRPPVEPGLAIFGFSEFLAALALLVLVFNSTDFLYRFRLAVAPIPLFAITFGAIIAIGIGTLLTDLWFAERWYALPWGLSRAVIQAFFGILFLATALLWIWFAFIRPPAFGRSNYKQFYDQLYRVVVRVADAELASMAAELVYSAAPLVEHASADSPTVELSASKVEEYARSTLYLLANRKLCRHIVASSPVTAIAIMQESSRRKAYSIPIGDFGSRVTTESIINRDSILYHEDDYGGDIVSRVQPFSKAMYGDFLLVEGSRGNTPLDINWRVAWEMDREQFGAYCRIVLITFKSFIDSGNYLAHSYALFRAIDRIQGAGRELYKLDGAPPDAVDEPMLGRLSAACEFVDEAINFLATKEALRFGRLRLPGRKGGQLRETLFDDLAKLMFELVHSAGTVRSPTRECWWIQHNTVWSRFFSFRDDSKAWRVIRHKFFRLIYDEITRLEEFPNYKGARVLAFCLNVMGIKEPAKNDYGKEYYALRRAVVSWTKKNFMSLAETHPPVAEHCLAGGITFEKKSRRLVQTFESGLRLKPTQHYLELDGSKVGSLRSLRNTAGTSRKPRARKP